MNEDEDIAYFLKCAIRLREMAADSPLPDIQFRGDDITVAKALIRLSDCFAREAVSLIQARDECEQRRNRVNLKTSVRAAVERNKLVISMRQKRQTNSVGSALAVLDQDRCLVVGVIFLGVLEHGIGDFVFHGGCSLLDGQSIKSLSTESEKVFKESRNMIMTPYNRNFQRRKPKVGRMDRRGLDNLENRYGRTLRAAVDAVFMRRVRELMEMYEAGADEETLKRAADAFQEEAERQLQYLANSAVPDWFSAVDEYAAGKFNRSIRDALGIDATSILSQPVYDGIKSKTLIENVGLIRNLAGDHYRLVRGALLDDYQGAGFPDGAKSLAGRIQSITGDTKYRASVIARDQTAKLNSQMAQARQEDAGVTHYIWRTAGDNRVVGTPGGLYPAEKLTARQKKAHGNHYERNREMFAWNNPPEDGHPGTAILCRCVALPVIVPAKLNAQPSGARVLTGAAVA